MDLKIELRTLASLHEASLRLGHGIRDTASQTKAWRAFSPSKFVYAFFTFNSIYSFDWGKSFAIKKAERWAPDERERLPKEEEQIKGYVKAIDQRLTPMTGQLFMAPFTQLLTDFSIADPASVLKTIPLKNATNHLRGLAKQMVPYTEKLTRGTVGSEDIYSTLAHVLRFVYLVRCNIFHGAKTHVQMADPDQQQRLLVYCAMVIAANSLLFEAAKRADIGWQELKVDFSEKGAQQQLRGDRRQAALAGSLRASRSAGPSS